MKAATLLDISGQRFGKLTALRHVGYRPGGAIWECQCDCGGTTVVYSQNLRKGRTKSCGCNTAKAISESVATHGESRGNWTPEYRAWRAMLDRCNQTGHSSYKYYGARGIKVCERWKASFANFVTDLGRKPSPKHSLDRIDVNGNYEPTNCRWATAIEQRRNRRDSNAIVAV